MTTKANKPKPIPGLDVVGHGIFLKPHQPYVLRPLLYPQTDMREHYCPENGQTYMVPDGYLVNESPPMPTKQALNRVVIEESFERFDKQMAVDAKVAASRAIFSIDANAGQTSQVRSEEDAYYALRSSFIPLWALYIANAPELPAEAYAHLPKSFDHDDRHIYDEFFERHGTHYVQRAWVGGQAKLIFTIVKSTTMSKQDVFAGVKASLSGLGDASANTSLKDNREQLRNNSECTIWGKGGAEHQLAALSTLDDEKYNAWLKSINSNPQTIELEVRGIWTLVKNPEQAKTLMKAYHVATSFTPISAAFLAPELDKTTGEITTKAYFVRGDQYFSYGANTIHTEKLASVLSRWPVLKDLQLTGQFGTIDAGFYSAGVLYLFSQENVLAINAADGKIVHDDKQPELATQLLSTKFPGVSFDRIDAVFSVGLDTIYFFHGGEYIRYDVTQGKALSGYPKPLVHWFGVTFDRIDAAIYRPDTGKAYFFRDDQHIRYDMCTYSADPGYPKAIPGSYVEDWRP